MDYRLVTKDAFTLVGRRRRMSLIYHGPNPEMEAFHSEVGEQTLDAIAGLSTTEPTEVISLCRDFDEGREDGGTFDFWLAAAVEGVVPAEAVEAHQVEELQVPALTWLVLTSADADVASIQQLWPEAYGQWLPANPYRVVDGPEMVTTVYDEHWNAQYAKLWLPVEREDQDVTV